MKQVKGRLVPKLRFKEFVSDGDWEEKNLGSVCKISNGKSNAQDHIENGIYPLFDRSAEIKKSNKFLFNCEAVILPGEGMRFVPKYFLGKFDLHQRAYALRSFSSIGKFIFYSMDFLQRELASKAVSSTVLSLRLPIIENFKIGYPKNPTEQQKIADCLSSLDELIDAEDKKLKALQRHKKGLMQELFPAEGQTLPKLRFPEFQNSPEWEKKTGNKLFDPISNKNHNSDLPILAITQEHGAIPRDKIDYRVSVTEKSIESYKVVEVGDFIISLRSFQGGIEYSNYKGLCSPAYIILRKKRDDHEGFFKHYFKTNRFIEDLNRDIEGIRDGKMVSYDQFSKIIIPIPQSKIEQQKIADFLSSIDNLITAQIKKLESLRLHKKGLMQQLFPNPDN